MNCDKCTKEIVCGEHFAHIYKKDHFSKNIILCEECAGKEGKQTNATCGGVINPPLIQLMALLNNRPMPERMKNVPSEIMPINKAT